MKKLFYIKNFKRFLLESSDFIIYKPKSMNTGGGWGSKEAWAEVYTLPSSAIDVINAGKETGEIRLGADTEGNVWMWSSAILHVVFWEINKNIKPYINFTFKKESEYSNYQYLYGAFNSDTNNNRADIYKEMEKNPKLFEMIFKKIKTTIPIASGVVFGNYDEAISLVPPFKTIMINE